MNDDILLFPLACGDTIAFYIQNAYGLIKYSYNLRGSYTKRTIGKFYIYHINIIEDIDNRFETLYNIIYVNLWTGRKETIKNKTFEETINVIRETRLIKDKDSIEEFLYNSIFNMPKITIDGVPFTVRERVDFEKENLPMKKK